MHAVSLVPIAPGNSALVVGAGTIGLLVQQALKVAGCSRVFVTDIDSQRLAMSQSLVATSVFLCGPNLLDEVPRATDGIGVDVAVEGVGNTAAVHAAINSVRKGGKVVLVGNVSPEVTIPFKKWSADRSPCMAPVPLPESIRARSNCWLWTHQSESAAYRRGSSPGRTAVV